MKKGLSILLVLAALFGFYGSAVSVNDILNCKDYWEEAGKQSTANMNKLEDGLNQLKDNEQAYLDGKDQLAEGEKALAEGEQAYAEGQAQLAQGEADYAAAPAQLAEGKKLLDENKASYTAGNSFRKVVNKASFGLSNRGAFKIIKTLLSSAGVEGVPASYKKMTETLNGLDALKDGTDGITDLSKEEAFQTAVATQDKKTQKKLKDAGVTSYKKLLAAIKQANAGVDSLEEMKDTVDLLTGKSKAQLKEILVKQSKDLKAAGITTYAALKESEKKLREGKELIDAIAAMDADHRKEAFVAQNADLAKAGITTYAGEKGLAASAAALTAGKALVDQYASMSQAQLKEFFVSQSPELAAAGITSYVGDEGLEAKEKTLREGQELIDTISASKDAFKNYAVKSTPALAAAGIESYSALESAVSNLPGLTQAKEDIDSNADALFANYDEDGRKAYFFNQIASQKPELAQAGITSYADLENAAASSEALAAIKTQIDSLAASKDAFKDYIVANTAELSAAEIYSYSDLEEKIAGLTQLAGAKTTIDNNADALFAGYDEAGRKEYFVSQNADLAAAGITTYAGDKGLAASAAALTAGKAQVDGYASMNKAQLKEFFVGQSADLAAVGITKYAGEEGLEAKEKALREGKALIDQLAALDANSLKEALVGQNEELAKNGIKSYSGDNGLAAKAGALTQGKATIDAASVALEKADSNKALAFVWSQLDAKQKAAAKSQGIDGTSYQALLNAISSLKGTIKDLNTLKKGVKGITGLSKNEALTYAIGTQDKSTQKQLKDSGINKYKDLTGAIGSLNLLKGFTKTLTSQKGNSNETTYQNIIKTLKNAGYGDMISALPATYAGLVSKLTEYEDGVRTYTEGLASYAAAPAQLAEGRAKLADAEQQLADGRKQLEDGRAQLAQYEDGEQQVRDGLATLVGTEADLDLVSILDRLNGDGDFDNGDNHLELDEGLAAVNVGRDYQAEDGVLITKEIMARAVGTAGLLAAGVFAVIAALLSFLKKNKGAGVFAILAAAAGAFGAVYGTQAGTYFSSIAGSTIGATGWIAAGLLGAVALAHAIVHFAAPKEV